ncbi:hypothetical protein CC86DRAFT_305594 [Ophiobolus disseminans]|uniref:DNA-directed RNA polymerase subunit n=1 Tax=Ophiobolus disseminans TaxID=1469910 RepID=A0A6A6ZHB3_9PLEO|nr:hypothetical protein CC86DRAFT_305594 [Ophiobolus disseminans]
MSLVGTLLFCTTCGNLLDRKASSAKTISCHICGNVNKNGWPILTQTTSKPSAFPTALREKRGEIQAINGDDIETWATVLKSCPACDSQILLWRDMQLRGADEGTTVFYRCSKCNNRSVIWSNLADGG